MYNKGKMGDFEDVLLRNQGTRRKCSNAHSNVKDVLLRHSVTTKSFVFSVIFDTVLRLMNTLARTINCGIFLALEYEKKIRQRDFFQRLCNVVCSFTVYSMVLIVQVNCLAMLPFVFAVRKIKDFWNFS